MEVGDLIRQLDEAIALADAQVEAARQRVEVAAAQAARLRTQRAAIGDALSEFEPDAAPEGEVAIARHDQAKEWQALPRTDAIERALRETGRPMRLKEIAQYLEARGRTGDTLSYISAGLSHLRSKDRPISQIARGIWSWSVPETPDTPSATPPDLAVMITGGRV